MSKFAKDGLRNSITVISGDLSNIVSRPEAGRSRPCNRFAIFSHPSHEQFITLMVGMEHDVGNNVTYVGFSQLHRLL